MSQVMTDRRTK